MTEKPEDGGEQALTLDEVEAVDSAYWACLNKIILASGVVFSFINRPYLAEPMSYKGLEAGCMKATGGGFSECLGILPSIHGCIYGRYPQGVGYFFPTDTDMLDYVKSRFNPLVSNNYESIGRFVRQGGSKSTDTASLKRINGKNLYLRGSTLMPGDEGGDSRKSTKLTGIQLDRAVVDEVDQVESEAIAKIHGRMRNAAVDGIPKKFELRLLANPSDEDRGVDLYWQRSDQRNWYMKCSCGELTCAIKEFLNDPEKCVGVYAESPDGITKGYIRCRKCGKPLGHNEGKYIADYPQRELAFWHWSHLSSAWNDPYLILRDFRNPPEGNLGDVYRLRLGLAYSSSEDKLRKDMVLACCGNDGIRESHGGPCAMGVDNDDKKHVVIGLRTGNDRYEIVKVAVCDNFGDVHDLARRYNVKFAVGDLRPNAESAREFQKAEKYRVYLCEYTDSPMQDVVFNDNNGIVKVFRTGIFDYSHRIVANQQVRLPRQCAAIDDFAVQCCNCVKSKDVDKKKNLTVYRYKKSGTGNDHYRNALNYFLVAAGQVRKYVDSRKYKTVSMVTDNEYVRV